MSSRVRFVIALLPLSILLFGRDPAAQAPLPTLTDSNLAVRAVITGLEQPTGTDILTGPNGNLFVVSLSNGAFYEISRR